MMQKSPSMTDALMGQATGTSERLLLGPTPGEEGPPEPATYDRLPADMRSDLVATDDRPLVEFSWNPGEKLLFINE